MKITIKMILVITMISTISYGQNMWLRGKIDLGSLHMMSNLSVDSIKQIIVTDDIESQNLLYPAAVKYLYYIQSAAEFLLDNLNSEIDTSLSVSENSAYWYKVYTNIFFRGLLGDNTAVEKMKIIANHATYLPRLLAIRALAEIGIYDNYSFVIAGYNDSPELFINLLAWYGNDSRYKEEVKSIIMNKVLSSNTTSEVIMLAYDLNVFSNEGTILLNTYFENNSGEERYDYFFELGIIDKDGQPERSIFALQDETNDTMRAKYLPNPYEVLKYGTQSNRYLEPKFINSIKTLSITDTNSSLYQLRNHFLLIYTPAMPDSTTPTNDLLNNLYNYVDSVVTYNWLGDLTFSNELKNILTTAKTNLQSGDSLACRIQVKSFQDSVDYVYKDSLNTDPRFVTIEGWKFLYWNAQYILDRLPELPIVVNADIEVMNPAMSLVNPGAFTMEVKGTGFTTNSTVYFNGNARTTTFVSDSILNAQILSTDVSVSGNFPVWVSDGTTNSDTLYYSVVSTLPKPVRPVLECVTNNGDGTHTAFFGYKNDNTVSVYIPVGNKNKFTPTPQDRGQTTVFQPGRKYKVFTVNFNGSNLVWTLNGRTSTASSNSAPCN